MDPSIELFPKFKDLSELKYWISLGMLPLRLLEAKMSDDTGEDVCVSKDKSASNFLVFSK